MQNFKSIVKTLHEILSRNEIPRWLPCSHIGFPITFKIKLDFCLISTDKCAKFEIDCSKPSWDIKRKQKSKMATWRPYWICNQVQNHKVPLPNINQYTCKISNWLLKHFMRYGAETKVWWNDRGMEWQSSGMRVRSHEKTGKVLRIPYFPLFHCRFWHILGSIISGKHQALHDLI